MLAEKRIEPYNETAAADKQTAKSAFTLFKNRMLPHLHRGGSYHYWWIRTKKGSKSIWWRGSIPLPLPHGLFDVYFGVHPVNRIPPRNDDGVLSPPARVRSQIEYIAAINCLFGEFDAKDFGGGKAAMLAHIAALPVRPSVVIESGGGFHVYWLLKVPFVIKTQTDREYAVRVQARWVELIGSDGGAKDLARVLRVPGTCNCKPHYSPRYPIVSFVIADFDCVYRLDELADLIKTDEPDVTSGTQPAPEEPVIEPQQGEQVAAGKVPQNSHYANAALDSELKILKSITENRNSQLNKSAFALGTLIGAHMLERQRVERELENAALMMGLDNDPNCGTYQIRRTIKSGIEAGMKRPRI